MHKTGTAPIGTAYLYTGQRWDELLGLYDYNARWYDPGTGRFVSADTVVPDEADPQAWNRLAYVENSPIGNTDPTGHCAESLTDEQVSQFESFGFVNRDAISLLLNNSSADDLLDRIQRAWNRLGDLVEESGFNPQQWARHIYVQIWYAFTSGYSIEHPVPNGGRNGGTGYADLYNESTGEVWDVKPGWRAYSESAIVRDTAQIARYTAGLGGKPGSPQSWVSVPDPCSAGTLRFGKTPGVGAEGAIYYHADPNRPWPVAAPERSSQPNRAPAAGNTATAVIAGAAAAILIGAYAGRGGGTMKPVAFQQ